MGRAGQTGRVAEVREEAPLPVAAEWWWLLGVAGFDEAPLV